MDSIVQNEDQYLEVKKRKNRLGVRKINKQKSKKTCVNLYKNGMGVSEDNAFPAMEVFKQRVEDVCCKKDSFL